MAANQTLIMRPNGAGGLASWNAGGGGSSGGSGSIGYSLPSSLADGNQLILTHSGSGFGSGPSNSSFEAFTGLTAGTTISTSNTRFNHVDQWVPPVTDADARSPGCSINGFVRHSQMADGDNNAWRSAEAGWSFAPCTEFLLSFAVKVPAGFRAPGASAPMASGQWPGDASWKMTWLFDTVNNDDLCLPTVVPNGVFYVQGNDMSTPMINDGANPAYWSWDKWVRFTYYLKADAANPSTVNGLLRQHVLSNGVQYQKVVNDRPIFAEGTVPFQWQELHVPAWAREGEYQDGKAGARTGVNVKTLYDDIYMASGAGAAARVELSDASTLAASTKRAFCEHVSWAAGEIVVKIRPGDLNLSGSVWAHITLADDSTSYSVQVH